MARAKFRNTLLRSTAIVGLTMASLLSAGSAEAATYNSGSLTQVGTGFQICRIFFTINYTGTVTDITQGSFPYDVIQFSVSDVNGNPAPGVATTPGFGVSYSESTLQVGATASTNRILQFNPQQAQVTGDLYVNIFEATSLALADRGAIIGQILIPQSSLSAAGGNCRKILPNVAPVVNAGPDFVSVGGSTATLSASATDNNGDSLTFNWQQTVGPAVTLANPTAGTTTFVAPPKTASLQTLAFAFTASDGSLTSAADTVEVTIPANVGPTANAGPDATVTGGSSVTLDGSGSTDGDGDPLTYQWTQIAGPAVTLSGDTTATPSFTAPQKTAIAQVLTFSLIANDGLSNSAPDTVDITIPANGAPVANAGPNQNVQPNATVSLDGSASSDGDGDPLTYQWVQTGGPAVTLTGANSATPSFVSPGLTAVAQSLTFELTVDDGFGPASTDSVTINLPANTAPVADAGPQQNVGQGSTVTLDGTGSSDVNGQPLTYQWTQTAGPAVTLSNPTSATPSFVVPVIPNPTAIVFELVVNDGIASSAADVLIITAFPNSPPVVDAGSSATVTPGSSVSLSGSATDNENDPLTYQWTQTAGPSVTLTGDTTLTPSFTAPAKTAAAQVLTFSLVANDGTSNSTADTVDITIPANVGPTAVAGPDATVGGGTSVTLDGTGSTDGDGDNLTYQWTQTGGPAVTLNGANTDSPSFTAPANTTSNQLLTFSLVVSDGIATSTADTVEITIPPNAPPTVDAGNDVTFPGGSLVTLEGTAADIENDPLTFQWTQVAGPAVTLNAATTLNPSFTAPPKTNAVQVLTFSLVANDGTSNSVADTVDVNIPANVGPTADAGPDATVGGGNSVTLDGTGSTDGDGDALTYQWVQTGGATVTLNGANTASPTFVAPVNATANQLLTFSLTVSDGLTSSTADSVDITIPQNTPPVVDAGQNVTVASGASVSLAGTASDNDNDPLTFTWTQTGGPAVTLTGANSLTPSFIAPPKTSNDQTLTFSLIANDGVSNSAPDTVEVTVSANVGPVADAGADTTATGGSSVTLNGTGSTDGDGDTLNYQWTQTGGPAVTLSGANTASPTFDAPASTTANQILTFSLTVSDGIATSTADSVDITILANAPPVVNAGTDVTVAGGANVVLEGSASDPENDALTYQWTQISGPQVSLSGDTTLAPSFTAPAKTSTAQLLTFSLIANDGTSTSAPDIVDITVAANVDAVANAGPDQTVSGGGTVTLDASGSSDADGDPLTYAWSQTTGPAVTLSDSSSANPTFVAPPGAAANQMLSFQVTVTDGFGQPSSDSVDITLLQNSPPVADAGVDQGPIDSGQTVTLNGSGSSDPDGNPLTYAWTQISGTPVTLSSSTAATPSFTAPLVNGNEDLVFSLVVNDGQIDSPADTVTVGIRAIGNISIIQRVVGADRTFSFSSNVAALDGTITTSGGVGQRLANGVAAGNYSVSAADLSAAGYAITNISCNDSDSVVNISSRSVAIALSPNENLVCTFTSANSREAAVTAINNFLTGRNALILAHQPDLQRRLDRLQENPGTPGSATAFGLPIPGSGKLPFNATLSNAQTGVSTSLAMLGAAVGDPDRGRQPFDIWAEAYFTRARLGNQRGDFRIFHTGADYRISNDLLVGVLAEIDDFDNRGPLAAGEAEGSGWMAGPYVMARIAPQLFGEVRAAWGSSDNRVSPLGTYVDDFKTRRSFYSGSLIGQFDIGKNTNVRPELTVRYIGEKARAYTDSLNITIPGQTVDQGDVSFRPRVQHLIELQDGWSLRPYGEAEAIYTFGTSLNSVLDNGLRARIEGGLDFFSEGGIRASIGGFHDGIGSSNYRSTGVHVTFSFGF